MEPRGVEPVCWVEGTLWHMFWSHDFQFLLRFGAFPRFGNLKYLGTKFLKSVLGGREGCDELYGEKDLWRGSCRGRRSP